MDVRRRGTDLNSGGIRVYICLGFVAAVCLAHAEREPVRWSPMQISVDLSANEMQTFAGRSCNKIIVLDMWDELLAISDVQASSNIMVAVYEMRYRWPSGAITHAFRVETRLKPVHRVGTLNEWIRLATNHPDFATISIPITYHICDDIEVMPKTLIFNNFLEIHPAKTIRVHTAGKVNLEIEQVKVDDTWLSVKQLRIDPNTVDLIVSIPERDERFDSPLQSAITIETTGPEEAEKTVPVVVLPHVPYDDPRILSIIALSNRLNRELVDSLSCEYTSTYQFSGGMERKQVGRYALSGNREYHRVDAVGTREDYLHYVRNGMHVRSSTASHVASLGTLGTSNIRPPQDFWGAAAGTAGGVIPELDRLNPEYDKVVSVQETISDGRQLIVVSVEQRLAATPPGQCDSVLTIYSSPKDGFLPVRVTSETTNRAGRNRSFLHEAVVTRILKCEIQDSTFYLPVEFHEDGYRDGRLYITDRRRIEEDSVQVNPDLSDERFRIDIEPGDMVIDKDLDVTVTNPGTALDLFGSKVSFEGERGDHMDVKTIFGQELARSWGPSLLGKPLPGWAEMMLEVEESQVKDKAVLVCFFDMNQRPSRNCITQLAKQAEQLKGKGVIVIAVQASKVDEDALNEWVKKNNIPCPVGMVQGGEEKTRFTWGVKALPWLILMDKEHVVIAEGFGLGELDDKLKQVGDGK